MTCQECRELMPAVVLKEATEADTTAVDTHLAECPACRPEFERLQAICAVLAAGPDDRLSELERLRIENSVYRGLATSRATTRGWGSFTRWPLRIAAALALFGLGYLARPHLTDPPAPRQPVVVDQFEATLATLGCRDLTAEMRFSAAGFRLITHGRKAALEELEKSTLRAPRRE